MENEDEIPSYVVKSVKDIYTDKIDGMIFGDVNNYSSRSFIGSSVSENIAKLKKEITGNNSDARTKAIYRNEAV